MKKTLILLSLLLGSGQAMANECYDGSLMSLGKSESRRLCKNAKDIGPLSCFMKTPESIQVFSAVTLCIGSTELTYLVPPSCYYQASTILPESAAVEACSGARNSAPAYCSQIIVKRTGDRALSPHAIGEICRHSIHAQDTLKTFDDLIINRKKTLEEALELVIEYNEERYEWQP